MLAHKAEDRPSLGEVPTGEAAARRVAVAARRRGSHPPLPERQPGEKEPSRVWEPGREHGSHVLRHTCAVVVREAGELIVSLAKWLGHSDPAFTLRTYTHFTPQVGARGLSAIEAWFTDLR
ncbi:hypothetical protein [Streptomyces sp. 067-1]|uniref:hypothetical protein n=1 Tax=Streptomyces sp. 067-1 TaxID=2789269 RepID=UPI0039F4DCAF